MDRRRFLMASGALLCQTMIPSRIIAEEQKGRVYFGYGPTGIGGKIGPMAVDTLYRVNSNFNYEFVHELGQSTIKATELVKGSLADGNTLLQSTSTILSLYPCLYRNLPYDPVEDFINISFLGEYSYMLVVGPLVDRSVKSLDDYVQWVFDNPEYRNFGTVLYGSESHLAGLVISQEKQIALRAQAYGGTSLLVEDLLDGILAAGFITTGNARHAIENGLLRVIGLCSNERHPQLPDVPTMEEQGIPYMDVRGWYSWLAPRRVSDTRVELLSKVTNEMKQVSSFREFQRRYWLRNLDLSPTEMRERIIKEIASCEQLYKRFKLPRIDY